MSSLAPSVEVDLLGPVDMRVGGISVHIERVQVRRLLAVLAHRPNTAFAVDSLVEELWPGELPQEPRRALRVVASRLRSALGAEAGIVASSAHEYCLQLAPDRVDTIRFESLVRTQVGAPIANLREALGSWRGAPFGGALGPPILDAEATRLDELRRSSIARLAELLIGTGAASDAVGETGTYLTPDQGDERLWAAHVAALRCSNRSGQAESVFAQALRTLRDIWGFADAVALRALVDDISRAAATASIAGRSERSGAPAHLVGRSRELERAIHSLEVAQAEPVIVLGPAGIGKSSLVRAIGEQSRRPVVTLACERDGVDGWATAEVLHLPYVASPGPAAVRTSEFVRLACDAIGRLALDHGLLVVVEDIHWAGERERALVGRLVRTAERLGVSVLLTCRNDEPSKTDALAAVSVPTLRRIPLGGLGRQAACALYRTISGIAATPAQAAVLMKLTAGNPYYIRALADGGVSLDAASSEGLRRIAGEVGSTRCATMEEASRQVLRTAAVLSPRVDLELLSVVADRAMVDVAAAVDEAVERGVLVDRGLGLEFDHDLTRLALGSEIGAMAAAVFNARAADVAEQLGRPADTVAMHILASGSLRTDERSRRYLLAGAARASALGQFDLARRFLAAAHLVEPDIHRQIDLACAYAWACECLGDRDASEDWYEQTFEIAQQRRLRSRMARAALGGIAFGGVVGGHRARRRRLVAALHDPPDDERLHLELVASAIAEHEAASLDVPAAWEERVEALALDDDEADLVRHAMSLRHLRHGRVTADDLARVEQYVGASRQIGQPAYLLEATEMLVRASITVVDMDRARDALHDLERTTRVHRWPRFIWSAAMYRALLCDLTNGPDEAELLARDAYSVGEELGVADAGNAFALFHLSLAVRRGDLAPLVPLIEQAIDGPSAMPAWHAVLALASAQAGDDVRALQELQRFWAGTGDRLRPFTHLGLALAIRAGALVGDRATLTAASLRLGSWAGNLLMVGAGSSQFGMADDYLTFAARAIEGMDGSAPGGDWPPVRHR